MHIPDPARAPPHPSDHSPAPAPSAIPIDLSPHSRRAEPPTHSAESATRHIESRHTRRSMQKFYACDRFIHSPSPPFAFAVCIHRLHSPFAFIAANRSKTWQLHKKWNSTLSMIRSGSRYRAVRCFSDYPREHAVGVKQKANEQKRNQHWPGEFRGSESDVEDERQHHGCNPNHRVPQQ